MTGHRWFVLPVLSVLTLILLAGCGSSGSSGPDEVLTIQITSDRTFLFTGALQTAKLTAIVVDQDGMPRPEIPLAFQTSNPGVATVDFEGVITAQTDTPGSTVITVSSGGVQSVVATAAVAELTPETVYLDDSEVVSVDNDLGEVILVRNGRTEGLVPGHILLSGDLGGLLHRVMSVDVQFDRVVVQVEPADLTDAFENLVVEAAGAEVDYNAVIGEQGVQLVNPSSAGGSLTPDDDALHEAKSGLSVGSLRDMKCESKFQVVNVGFTGVSIQHRLSLVPRVDLVISSRTVQRFDIYTDGLVQVTAAVGEITLSGGVTGKVECKIEMKPIPLAFVPIVGPLGIGPTATPAVGFELTAQYTLGSIKLAGPRVDKGVRSLMGLGYTNSDGFRLIREFEDVGDGVSLGSGKMELNQEFKFAIDPFFGVTLNKSVLLGRWSLADFGFVGAKVGGGSEITMTLPFGSREKGYKGPRWNFYIGASADLNPMLDRLKSVEKFFARIGIPDAAKISALDLKLFELKRILLESPNPTMSASPGEVDAGEPVSLGVNARGAENAKAEFLAFKDKAETGVTIAETTTNSAGIGDTTWTPEEDDGGEYDMTVLVFDGIFGSIGIPYGPDKTAKVRVSVDTFLDIDPPGISDGEIDVEYGFTLTAAGIPGNTPVVTFEWNFGDGTTGNSQVNVVDGGATIGISNTYKSKGVYGLIAVVKDATDVLADASAIINIGEVEEREEELNACDTWKEAQSGGEGATVDNWDITTIPQGATFEIQFDAYSIPDKFIVEYPNGSVVVDTGWRGDSSYNGNPRYPGGIAGAGQGSVQNLFSKAGQDTFKVTVIGGEPGTAWDYSVRCTGTQ